MNSNSLSKPTSLGQLKETTRLSVANIGGVATAAAEAIEEIYDNMSSIVALRLDSNGDLMPPDIEQIQP